MRKFIKIFLILIIAGFIILQFFQPKKNQGEITNDHILKQENVPENVKTILQTSCFDCHSNNTHYLWYHHISPVGWMINDHIVEGKEELNFSEWGKLDIFDKLKTLDEICTEVEKRKMPIKPYLRMHPKARLSDEQVEELCAWTKKLGDEMMSGVEQ